MAVKCQKATVIPSPFGEDPNRDGEKVLRKAIMRIVTNSQLSEEPKNPDESTIFEIYKAFATPEEVAAFRHRFENRHWFGVKPKRFCSRKSIAKLRHFLQTLPRTDGQPKRAEEILQLGAEKARRESHKRMEKVRKAITSNHSPNSKNNGQS